MQRGGAADRSMNLKDGVRLVLTRLPDEFEIE
jgi:hypothetical protein